MRLSTRAHYAVRAVLDLALHAVDRPVPVQEIAERQAISQAYLEQLFAKLRRGRIIRSVRGPRGGYLLARPAAEVTLAEIMEWVDEPLEPVACLDKDGHCDREGGCNTHHIWRDLGRHIRSFLETLTVEQALRGAPMEESVNATDTGRQSLSSGG